MECHAMHKRATTIFRPTTDRKRYDTLDLVCMSSTEKFVMFINWSIAIYQAPISRRCLFNKSLFNEHGFGVD